MIADQLSKLAALKLLGLYDERVTIIPGLLWLHVIKNTGAAFGLFQSLGPLLVLITLVLMYTGFKIARHEQDPLLLTGLGLILGGAAGNLIDRIVRKGVIDFIEVPNWPLFNLADSAITIGTIVVLYYGFIKSRSETGPENASDPV